MPVVQLDHFMLVHEPGPWASLLCQMIAPQPQLRARKVLTPKAAQCDASLRMLNDAPADILRFLHSAHPVVRSPLRIARKLQLLPDSMHSAACDATFARHSDALELPVHDYAACARLLQLAPQRRGLRRLVVTNACELNHPYTQARSSHPMPHLREPDSYMLIDDQQCDAAMALLGERLPQLPHVHTIVFAAGSPAGMAAFLCSLSGKAITTLTRLEWDRSALAGERGTFASNKMADHAFIGAPENALSALEALPNLQHLDLRAMATGPTWRASSGVPLAALTQLTFLDIGGASIGVVQRAVEDTELSALTGLRHLGLSASRPGDQLDAASAAALAVHIAALSHLTSLDVAERVFSDGLVAILRRVIDAGLPLAALDACRCCHSTPTEDLCGCLAALSSVTRLAVSAFPPQPAGAAPPAPDGLPPLSPKLQHLKLRGVAAASFSMPKLSALASLTYLDMSGTLPTALVGGARSKHLLTHVCDTLRALTALRCFKYSQNCLDPDDADELQLAMSRLPHLSAVKLSMRTLRVSPVVAAMTQLTGLWVKCKELCDAEDAPPLCLPAGLRLLAVTHTSSATASPAEVRNILASLAGLTALTRLALALPAAQRTLPLDAGVLLAMALRGLVRLEHLALTRCGLHEESLPSLARALATLTGLTELHLLNIGFGQSAARALQHALTPLSALRTLVLVDARVNPADAAGLRLPARPAMAINGFALA